MRWISLGGICMALPLLIAGQSAPTPPPPAAAPGMPTLPAAAPSAPAHRVAPQFIVLLDAAHGGSDTGARLSPGLLEKDLVLDFTGRLRSMLAARGFDVRITRNADINLSAINRAEIANRTPSAACIIIHATATGSGVHLYTSSLTPTTPALFLPWQTAQSSYITASLKLSSDIDSALAHAEIPVTLGRTSIQPMDSLACPAVAVEIAPLQPGASTKGSPISDVGYQRSILGALAAALEQWHNDWRQEP